MTNNPLVVVVSHERSGTHYMLNSLVKNFGYPKFEDSVLGEPDTLREKILSHLDDKRLVKGHQQWEWFEGHWDELRKKAKFIYVRRDGMDTLASCFHYMDKHQNLECFPPTRIAGGRKDFGWFMRQNPAEFSFDGWYSKVKSKDMAERWARHVRGWMTREGVCQVKFEDLKQNFAETIGEVARFLDINPPNIPIEPTVADRGIDNRLGVVGDHKNLFTESDRRFFRDRVLGVMR